MFDTLRNNWKTVRADPNKWTDFNIKVVKIVLGALTLLIVWQFVSVIIGFNTGNSAMTMIGRALALLFMGIIIYKIYKTGYIPLRDRMLHSLKVPAAKQEVKSYSNVDLDTMIDDTIKDLEKNKKQPEASK